ncbi:glycoside hydrolase family 16 protein [Neolentinus lepideus HHB14362 ss-1]|uniref:Glycoside hydrolase family 16 protein n=1 Tax=Neolentinus lepideus HHB14362 ss-1 TaxID=1314782 RepID=A0A165U8R1_9AGAM|nr:glycoside hydrolase family 16 protein [Neolentinus lepideus HHB14362 ss-1]
MQRPAFAVAHCLTLLLFAQKVLSATYTISDSIVGSGFDSAFSYQAISDPTNGRVNYVDEATAQADNLTYASGNTFILRADDTTTLSSSGPGRNSVRLQSNNQYTTHVAVFDIRHMPQGCGTWPAVWEVGANWPDEGETDILEGVNDQGPDQITLHTSSGCTMPSSRSMTGTSLGTDCSTADTNNAGCGVQSTDGSSYGPTFNNDGGGWYAMERTSTFIKVWFWSRNSGSVPSDVENGASSVNTDNWGTPTAYFPDTDCDFSSHFGPHNIIINLTFCGDWAGAVYSSDGCPGTCTDYVDDNPSAFANAYFDFASIRIYE